MTSPHTDPTPGDARDAALPAAALSRRLLLRRSLGAATPVVLTLASLPSHAAPGCINPSGFISQATFNSRHPGGVICAPNGPNHFTSLSAENWPRAPGTQSSAATLKFKDVFNGIATNGNDETTLLGVLTGSSSSYARYCVAAYANALNPPLGYPMTVNQARALWVEFHGGGQLFPAFPQRSLGWDEAKALDWLSAVMNP